MRDPLPGFCNLYTSWSNYSKQVLLMINCSSAPRLRKGRSTFCSQLGLEISTTITWWQIVWKSAGFTDNVTKQLQLTDPAGKATWHLSSWKYLPFNVTSNEKKNGNVGHSTDAKVLYLVTSSYYIADNFINYICMVISIEPLVISFLEKKSSNKINA